MSLSSNIKEKIAIEVIKVLVTRFESFPDDASNNRNAPFHEAFLNAFSDKLSGKVSDTPFFISLSSWLQGLNTTLGQTFFENVAHHLCNGEKREYTSKKLGNLQIEGSQKSNISSIITNLSNALISPNLTTENQLIFQSSNTALVNAIDFSADVFIEDNNSITAIELKSVKPNSGEMRGEKQKILEGKAALYRKFTNKQIKFYIGFPFDPTVNPLCESVSSFNKTRFLNSIINMNKFFAQDETLIACELWDLLSEQTQTMEQILEIINTIATPNFLIEFQFINDSANRKKSNYIEKLEKWFLYSEKNLVVNDMNISSIIKNGISLTRIYNKTPFDNKGNYNFERYSILMNILN
ncbi:MAG: TdeIII family type II restriction endonuclease [Thermoplasmatales archaeon]|nr:TdeIII family type II restriction endonuclease [Candidatus Methanoperedenaceae archaeon]MCG2827567.1 TdeIII family type II restriction endonuclease [Thermoplasmatales archaeon]